MIRMYTLNCPGFTGPTRNPDDIEEIIEAYVEPHTFFSEQGVAEGSHKLCPYCSVLYASSASPWVERRAEENPGLRKVTLTPTK